MQTLTQLIFKSKNHISFDDFVSLLSFWVSNLNLENKTMLHEKYNHYKKLFDSPPPRKILHPSHFGFDRKSTTLAYYLDRGWSETEAKSFLLERQALNSKKRRAEKYGDEKLNQIMEARRLKSNATLNARPDINRINLSKGKCLRIENLVNKINPETNKLFSIDEAKLQLANRQQKASIARWAAVKSGKTIFIGNIHLQYYLNKGFSEEVAGKLLKQRQATFSLESCIAKYGELVGREKWRARQIKWQATLNSLPEEEKLRILKAKTFRSKRYSNEGLKFINKLLLARDIDSRDESVYCGENEYFLIDGGKICFYDLVVKKHKLCVEYNGSCFHPNPAKLISEDFWNKWVNPISKETADQQLARDSRKKKVAIKNGFYFLKFGI